MTKLGFELENNIKNITNGQDFVYVIRIVNKQNPDDVWFYVGKSKVNLNILKGAWYFGFSRIHHHVNIDGSIRTTHPFSLAHHMAKNNLDTNQYRVDYVVLTTSHDPKNDEIGLYL